MVVLREAAESFSIISPGESFGREPTVAPGASAPISTFGSDASCRPQAKMTSKGLVFTMMLSVIGTTVLGISAQMQKAGWILGPLTLIVGCAIVSEMTYLVSATIDKLLADGKVESITSYPEYARAALGPGGSALAALTSTLAPLGMICNGMILCAENLEFIFKESLDLSSRTFAFVLTVTTFVYAFWDLGVGSLARLLRHMEVPSWFANAFCIIFAWVAIGMGSHDAAEIPKDCRTSASGDGYWSVGPHVAGEHMMGGSLQLAAVASYGFYCFAVVVSLPKFHSEMEQPSEVVRSSITAFVSCTVLFLSIMIPGYAIFGNWGSANIIKSMTHDRPAGWWALNAPWETGVGNVWGYVFAISVTANLLMTDGIYVPICVNNLEGAYGTLTGKTLTIPVRISVRFFVVCIRTLVATLITSFLIMTGLTSSLFCICNNILMPIVGFYNVEAAQVSPVRKALHVLIFCFGFFCVVCGTAAAVYDLQKEKVADVAPGSFVRSDLAEACRSACAAALGNATLCGVRPTDVALEVFG